LCAGEKEFIDCGQLGLDIFNALKDEFKVNIFAVFVNLCMSFTIFCIVQLITMYNMLLLICITGYASSMDWPCHPVML